jgi:P27 family predicted phage terminase small subunit
MPQRGRPPKPIAAHRLDGTFRRDRHGDDVREPSGKPTRPDWLSDTAAALWESLVPDLEERGIATAADWPELSAMCDWWSRYRQASEALDRVDYADSKAYRLQILAGAAWKNFSSVASRFGLNPADRARLRNTSQAPADALSDFLNG